MPTTVWTEIRRAEMRTWVKCRPSDASVVMARRDSESVLKLVTNSEMESAMKKRLKKKKNPLEKSAKTDVWMVKRRKCSAYPYV